MAGSNLNFYLALAAFCGGIVLAITYRPPLQVGLWLLVLALGVAVVWRKNGTAVFAPHLISLNLILFFLALGMLRTGFYEAQFGHSVLADKVGQEVTLTGVVTSEPERKERSLNFYFKTETGDKLLVTTERLNQVFYGDKLQVSGKLQKPAVFTTELGRTFNYPAYLKAKGAEYRLSFTAVSVLDKNQANPFIYRLLKTKAEFISKLKLIIPEPEVGLGEGLLLGVKEALGKELENDFRKTGIIHIVVLSGYNIMLVVAFVLFFLSLFLSLRWRAILGLLAIWSFALLVGLSATVTRASIMASLVLLAQLLSRRYDVLRGLFIAGAIMLFINPYLLLYDIGFQLSFMATFGLILASPKLEEWLMAGKWWGVKDFVLATVATQLAVLPLLLYHMGQVSVVAVVVNLLVLPVVSTAMLFTFVTGLIGFVSLSAASIIGYLAYFSLTYIIKIAIWFADLPFAVIQVSDFSVFHIFLYYLAAVGIWFWFKRKQKSKGQLSGWTVEEEAVVKARLLNRTRNEAKKDELPVFFR